MDNMNKSAIKFLEAIHQFGSISHAAKHLYISQPYLSKFIKDLELDLGVTLINRETSPFELTFAGERYLDYMRKFEALDNDMRQELQTIAKSKKGRIRIGVNPILASHVLYSILPEFLKQYPDIEIELVEEVAHRIEQLLFDQKVDVAITILPLYQEGIQYDLLYTERIFLALPPSDTFNNKNLTLENEEALLKSLNHEKFILLKPEMALRQLTDQILEQYGIYPKIVMETISVENALRLSSEGLGITIVPESVKLRSSYFKGHYVCINPKKYYNQVVMAYKSSKHDHLSEAAKSLIEMAKAHYNTASSNE